MEHLIIQSPSVALDLLASHISGATDASELAIVAAAEIMPMAFAIHYRDRLKLESAQFPQKLHYKMREILMLGAVAAHLSDHTLVLFSDDTVGEAFVLFAKSKMIAFEAQTDDAFYSMQTNSIMEQSRGENDDAIRTYATLDKGMRLLSGLQFRSYEQLAASYEEAAKRRFPPESQLKVLGPSWVVDHWKNPEKIFDADIFVRLTLETIKFNPPQVVASLCLDFLSSPICEKPHVFSQACAILQDPAIVPRLRQLIQPPVKTGEWVLAFAFNASAEAILAWLQAGRPYSFVALESLEYIVSEGARPDKLVSESPLREFLNQNRPGKHKKTDRSMLATHLADFERNSKIGPRERSSLDFLIRNL